MSSTDATANLFVGCDMAFLHEGTEMAVGTFAACGSDLSASELSAVLGNLTTLSAASKRYFGSIAYAQFAKVKIAFCSYPQLDAKGKDKPVHFALTGAHDVDEIILIRQLATILAIFKFYHKSYFDVKESLRARFACEPNGGLHADVVSHYLRPIFKFIFNHVRPAHAKLNWLMETIATIHFPANHQLTFLAASELVTGITDNPATPWALLTHHDQVAFRQMPWSILGHVMLLAPKDLIQSDEEYRWRQKVVTCRRIVEEIAKSGKFEVYKRGNRIVCNAVKGDCLFEAAINLGIIDRTGTTGKDFFNGLIADRLLAHVGHSQEAKISRTFLYYFLYPVIFEGPSVSFPSLASVPSLEQRLRTVGECLQVEGMEAFHLRIFISRAMYDKYVMPCVADDGMHETTGGRVGHTQSAHSDYLLSSPRKRRSSGARTSDADGGADAHDDGDDPVFHSAVDADDSIGGLTLAPSLPQLDEQRAPDSPIVSASTPVHGTPTGMASREHHRPPEGDLSPLKLADSFDTSRTETANKHSGEQDDEDMGDAVDVERVVDNDDASDIAPNVAGDRSAVDTSQVFMGHVEVGLHVQFSGSTMLAVVGDFAANYSQVLACEMQAQLEAVDGQLSACNGSEVASQYHTPASTVSSLGSMSNVSASRTYATSSLATNAQLQTLSSEWARSATASMTSTTPLQQQQQSSLNHFHSMSSSGSFQPSFSPSPFNTSTHAALHHSASEPAIPSTSPAGFVAQPHRLVGSAEVTYDKLRNTLSLRTDGSDVSEFTDGRQEDFSDLVMRLHEALKADKDDVSEAMLVRGSTVVYANKTFTTETFVQESADASDNGIVFGEAISELPARVKESTESLMM